MLSHSPLSTFVAALSAAAHVCASPSSSVSALDVGNTTINAVADDNGISSITATFVTLSSIETTLFRAGPTMTVTERIPGGSSWTTFWTSSTVWTSEATWTSWSSWTSPGSSWTSGSAWTSWSTWTVTPVLSTPIASTTSTTIVAGSSSSVAETSTWSSTEHPSTTSLASSMSGDVTLPVTFAPTLVPTLPPTTSYVLAVQHTDPPKCVVDEAEVGSTALRISDSSGHLFVPKSVGRVGLLEDSDFPSAQPDEPQDEQAIAAANEAYFKSIQYRFVRASNGRFDLTTTVYGATKYVAWNPSDNSVVLSGSSSSSGSGMTTSIFSFSCDGNVVIQTPDGRPLMWVVTDDGSYTHMVEGTPSNEQKVLLSHVADPDPAPVPRGNRPTRRDGRFGAVPDLGRRMSPFTDGTRPRLPSQPWDMHALPAPGARPMASNGCGSGPLLKLIPQYRFGFCCDMHDYCYDNCATGLAERCTHDSCRAGQYEACNQAFYDCMSGVCSGIPWSRPLDRAVCEAGKRLYKATVDTYLGGDAFDAATTRCAGYCPNGAPYCGGNACVSPNDDNNCGQCGTRCDTANLFGCRNNRCECLADTANDSSNCGACGNKCPLGTVCAGSQCRCAVDQCDNLCVDTKTDPRNCGRCGTICPAGPCVDGQCVANSVETPPAAPVPTKCLPTDAVQNGAFDTVADIATAPPWTRVRPGDPNSTFSVRYDSNAAVLQLISTNAGWWDFSSYTSFGIGQTLAVCPGTNYELTLAVAFHARGSAQVYIDSTPIGTINSDSTGQFRTYGPFPFTTLASQNATISRELRIIYNAYTYLAGSAIRVDNVSALPGGPGA